MVITPIDLAFMLYPFHYHKIWLITFFRIIIYYPITAILALFSNIISNPLDENTLEDLEILQDAPSLFRSIPIRKLRLAELTHLRFLDAFTMELARLSRLAIETATGTALIQLV